MSVGIFELVNGVLTKKKIAGKTLMDAQLNANSRNGVQNRIITGEINDIKDDISTINTQLTTMTSKFVAQGNGVTFGADTDGLYIQWRLSATNIFKLSINTSSKYFALANFNGTSWTTVWSGTLN